MHHLPGRIGSRVERSERSPEALTCPAATATGQDRSPAASRTHVSGSVSTTAGGVPRVCRAPATHWMAANGGTRTSTLLPGCSRSSRARKWRVRSRRSPGAARSSRTLPRADATSSTLPGRSRDGTAPVLPAEPDRPGSIAVWGNSPGPESLLHNGHRFVAEVPFATFSIRRGVPFCHLGQSAEVRLCDLWSAHFGAQPVPRPRHGHETRTSRAPRCPVGRPAGSTRPSGIHEPRDRSTTGWLGRHHRSLVAKLRRRTGPTKARISILQQRRRVCTGKRYRTLSGTHAQTRKFVASTGYELRFGPRETATHSLSTGPDAWKPLGPAGAAPPGDKQASLQTSARHRKM
jgi:hypothetical protein